MSIEFSRTLDQCLLWKRLSPGDIDKSILRVEVGQQIYTPSSIDSDEITDFDRPYAGYLFVKGSVHSFWKHMHSLQLALELGIIGPDAGGEQVQTWWHKLIAFKRPKGWQYQINEGAMINVDLDYQRSWINRSWFNIISNVGIQAGTAFDNLSAGLTMRAGKINPFYHSAITKSLLTSTHSSKSGMIYRKREWFLFIGVNNKYVIHNTLIEGRISRRRSMSVHTENAQQMLIALNTGFAYSTAFLTGMITIHQLSSEINGTKGHLYASIEMAMRFK